jgi:hypothetical protein
MSSLFEQAGLGARSRDETVRVMAVGVAVAAGKTNPSSPAARNISPAAAIEISL